MTDPKPDKRTYDERTAEGNSYDELIASGVTYEQYLGDEANQSDEE